MFKCGKSGHTAKYCWIRRKINQLERDEEIVKNFELILIGTSSESEERYDNSKEELQIHEITF